MSRPGVITQSPIANRTNNSLGVHFVIVYTLDWRWSHSNSSGSCMIRSTEWFLLCESIDQLVTMFHLIDCHWLMAHAAWPREGSSTSGCEVFLEKEDRTVSGLGSNWLGHITTKRICLERNRVGCFHVWIHVWLKNWLQWFFILIDCHWLMTYASWPRAPAHRAAKLFWTKQKVPPIFGSKLPNLKTLGWDILRPKTICLKRTRIVHFLLTGTFFATLQ